jgi:hypothetical protein
MATEGQLPRALGIQNKTGTVVEEVITSHQPTRPRRFIEKKNVKDLYDRRRTLRRFFRLAEGTRAARKGVKALCDLPSYIQVCPTT